MARTLVDADGLLHVDDDFGAVCEVCPDIGMPRLQPVTG